MKPQAVKKGGIAGWVGVVICPSPCCGGANKVHVTVKTVVSEGDCKDCGLGCVPSRHRTKLSDPCAPGVDPSHKNWFQTIFRMFEEPMFRVFKEPMVTIFRKPMFRMFRELCGCET